MRQSILVTGAQTRRTFAACKVLRRQRAPLTGYTTSKQHKALWPCGLSDMAAVMSLMYAGDWRCQLSLKLS